MRHVLTWFLALPLAGCLAWPNGVGVELALASAQRLADAGDFTTANANLVDLAQHLPLPSDQDLRFLMRIGKAQRAFVHQAAARDPGWWKASDSLLQKPEATYFTLVKALSQEGTALSYDVAEAATQEALDCYFDRMPDLPPEALGHGAEPIPRYPFALVGDEVLRHVEADLRPVDRDRFFAAVQARVDAAAADPSVGPAQVTQLRQLVAKLK